MKKTPAQHLKNLRNSLDQVVDAGRPLSEMTGYPNWLRPSKITNKEQAMRNYHQQLFQYISETRNKFWKKDTYQDDNERTRALKNIVANNFTVGWDWSDHQLCQDFYYKIAEDMTDAADRGPEKMFIEKKYRMHSRVHEILNEP